MADDDQKDSARRPEGCNSQALMGCCVVSDMRCWIQKMILFFWSCAAGGMCLCLLPHTTKELRVEGGEGWWWVLSYVGSIVLGSGTRFVMKCGLESGIGDWGVGSSD